MNLVEDRVLLATAPQAYVVTNTSDSASDPGSLRAAIASADADTYPTGTFDTIDFDLSPGPQTIDLTTIGDSTDDGTSALVITAPILIDGSAAPGLTIARDSSCGHRPFPHLLRVASDGGNPFDPERL